MDPESMSYRELQKKLKAMGLKAGGSRKTLEQRYKRALGGAEQSTPDEAISKSLAIPAAPRKPMKVKKGLVRIPITSHIRQYHLLNATKLTTKINTGKDPNLMLMRKDRSTGVANPRYVAYNPGDVWTMQSGFEMPKDGLFFLGEDGYGHDVTPAQAQKDRETCAAMFPTHSVVDLNTHVNLVPVPLTYDQGSYGSCQLTGSLNMLLITGFSGGPCLLNKQKALALYGYEEEGQIHWAKNHPNELPPHHATYMLPGKNGYKTSFTNLRGNVDNPVYGTQTDEGNFNSTEGLHLQIFSTLYNSQINTYKNSLLIGSINSGESFFGTAHVPAMLQAFGYIDNAEMIDNIRITSTTMREMLVDMSWFATPFNGPREMLGAKVTAEVDLLITTLIDLGRPVCVNHEGHTRTIVAYNDDYFCFADNWGFLKSTNNDINKRLSFADGRPKERIQRMYGGLAVVRRQLVSSTAKDLMWVKHPDFTRTSMLSSMPISLSDEVVAIGASRALLEMIPTAATLQELTGSKRFTDICA